RDFKERLVALHSVAGLLEPLCNRALKNRLAHLGHQDFRRHGCFSPLWIRLEACRLSADDASAQRSIINPRLRRQYSSPLGVPATDPVATRSKAPATGTRDRTDVPPHCA